MQNLNATDKLKLDYRLTDYNNQGNFSAGGVVTGGAGIFMNYSSTPQNLAFGGPASSQNQRYGSGSGATKAA